MKKYLLSLFVVLTSVVYALSRYFGGASTNIFSPSVTQSPVNPSAAQSRPPSSGEQSVSGKTAPGSTTTTPPPSPVPTPPLPAPKPRGQYTDGTYTGNQADAYYGIVQIQVLIQSGKITSVEFLQYPNDRRTSQYINGQAMPILKSEAIRAQSANVDIVSGATDTSMAFRESLADALTQAKI